MALVTIFITGGTSTTIPSAWDRLNNSAETVGGGGGGGGSWYDGGGGGNASDWGGTGGGGGAYSKQTNINIAPLTVVTLAVGTGGAAGAYASQAPSGGDTYFNGSSLATSSCGAKGGTGGYGGSFVTTALGGQASAGVGAVKYSGGNGGGRGNYNNAGGGGGAAGPHGAGGNGAANGVGGTGDNGTTAAATNGVQWDATHGSGGGASYLAGAGLYGAAGNGGQYVGVGPRAGTGGLIVLTYQPLVLTINVGVVG
jgi:hypothetical protein